jgi:DNA-binding transcriptional ArsR family regulator
MDSSTAVAALAALAQDSRLRIHRLLVEAGPTGLAAGEIGAALKLAPATLSFHLKELAHAGLVRSRQAGRFVYYSPDFTRMNDLLAYLTENCCARQGPGCCGPVGGAAKRTPAKKPRGAHPARRASSKP